MVNEGRTLLFQKCTEADTGAFQNDIPSRDFFRKRSRSFPFPRKDTHTRHNTRARVSNKYGSDDKQEEEEKEERERLLFFE